MREFLNVTKAVSDETRVRVLMFLRPGELCVCEIVELLELAPSTVSKHMSILTQAGLVEQRKSGRWHYYRLAENGGADARQVLEWMASALEKSPVIREDAKRLKALLKRNAQACCVAANGGQTR